MADQRKEEYRMMSEMIAMYRKRIEQDRALDSDAWETSDGGHGGETSGSRTEYYTDQDSLV